MVGVLYSNPLPYAFDDAAAVSFLWGMSAVTEHAALGLLLVPAAGGGRSAGRESSGGRTGDGGRLRSLGDERRGAAVGGCSG